LSLDYLRTRKSTSTFDPFDGLFFENKQAVSVALTTSVRIK